MRPVLLVDDEPGVLYMLREVLESRGHRVITASDGTRALTLIDEASLVVTDLSMPGMSGLELLGHLRRLDPTMPVVMLTAHGNERIAVAAMKAGASDYLTKPVDIDELAMVVERELEAVTMRAELRRMKAERSIGKRLIAESAPMKRLLEAVTRVATKEISVLVRGETGTGKELIASLLHAESKRAKGPIVRFNCAALPAELAEAELFGHARGAFTGAVQARRGIFQEAHGGTLVLDEIGELPLALQPKLLRALQEGEIQPVGGRIEKVDVRVVASTHRDLAAEAKAGRFREDLYYRLAVVELVVPTLRERREEIPELAAEFARRFGERFGMTDVVLEPALVAALAAEPWPGNVRQLENTIARLVALAGPRVALADHVAGAQPPKHDDDDATESDVSDTPLPLREQVEAFERGILVQVLRETGQNQSRAARRLGIGRATLIDKMKRYQLRG